MQVTSKHLQERLRHSVGEAKLYQQMTGSLEWHWCSAYLATSLHKPLPSRKLWVESFTRIEHFIQPKTISSERHVRLGLPKWLIHFVRLMERTSMELLGEPEPHNSLARTNTSQCRRTWKLFSTTRANSLNFHFPLAWDPDYYF